MQFPVYLRLGPLSLHPHWVFECLAYAIAFRVYLGLRQRYGDPVSSGDRWWVIAAAAAGAALGSKFWYWLEDPLKTLHNWHNPFYLMAGKTIVGGLIGGLIAVEWTKRRIGVHKSTGDLFAIPLALGISVGRVGCFLSGLADNTYGNPTTLPWGVNFGDGVPRHPTQLYEIVFLLLLSVTLWQLMRSPHGNGNIFKLFVATYAGWRLLIDFVKPRVAVAGLSSLQWSCLLLLLYCAYGFSRDYIRSRREVISEDMISRVEAR